jgi:hypothetical protein
MCHRSLLEALAQRHADQRLISRDLDGKLWWSAGAFCDGSDGTEVDDSGTSPDCTFLICCHDGLMAPPTESQKEGRVVRAESVYYKRPFWFRGDSSGAGGLLRHIAPEHLMVRAPLHMCQAVVARACLGIATKTLLHIRHCSDMHSPHLGWRLSPQLLKPVAMFRDARPQKI